jgi:beta-galactosidase
MKRRIDRRSFVKSSGVGLIGVSLFPLTSRAAQDGSESGRRVYPLNRKWLFSEKNVAGGTALRFDDSRFTRVTIPHTNKMMPWHGFDDKDYQFVSLYRRHFQLPPGANSKRVFVDFGAVMTAATVHINGQRLGEYRGGYTPFSYELTEHLNWRGDNVIAVEVDSTERSDIPPFGGEIDYLTFGGIYRDVELRIVPQTFIENVFAKPVDVLGFGASSSGSLFLASRQSSGFEVENRAARWLACCCCERC